MNTLRDRLRPIRGGMTVQNIIRSLNSRVATIESLRGASEKLQEDISHIDIKEHIAPVYHALHDDITEGKYVYHYLPGGRGSGKSSFCALELVYQIMADPEHISNALVVRKYAVTLRQSVFATIQWAIEVLGVSEYWRSTVTPMRFIYQTGQEIRLTGLDDPQKLKSLKATRGYYRFLWGEEFCELSGEMEVRNLQQSVLRGGDRFTVLYSFNPPISSANWCNQWIQRPDDRAITLQTDYTMVPASWLGFEFIAEAERLKTVNERAYLHEYMGIPTGSGSEVFENLEVRKIEDNEISGQVYAGLDFGFSKDPCCFLRVSYSPKTETIYVLSEIYKAGLQNSTLADMIIDHGYQYSGSYHYDGLSGTRYRERQVIYADSADPKSIADLKDFGLKVKPCTKFGGCVAYRIRWLQHRKIIVDPVRTPETARELQNYSFDTDRKTGEVLSSLPDKDNHSIDSLAYALDRPVYSKKYPA